MFGAQILPANTAMKKMWSLVLTLEKGLRMEKIKGGHDRMPACHVLAGENRAVMMMLIFELILHLDPS